MKIGKGKDILRFHAGDTPLKMWILLHTFARTVGRTVGRLDGLSPLVQKMSDSMMLMGVVGIKRNKKIMNKFDSMRSHNQ